MGNLIIAINDLKLELTRCINNAASKGVPFAVIEPIVRDIMIQVQNTARAELERVRSVQTAQVNDNDEVVG